MPDSLTDWEIQILREVAGELPPSPWGAAVGAALEHLVESGYLTKGFGGLLTPKARAYLAKLKAHPND